MDVVAIDLGGTHVRFAIARVEGGKVVSLSGPCTLETAAHASLARAWAAYQALAPAPFTGRLPRAVALAVACPIHGEVLQMTNHPWVIRPALLAGELGVDHMTLINDFGAVGHAVAQLPETELRHIAGPDRALPPEGVISIIGPGTGLGVAQLLRTKGGYHVVETEGSHQDFAPLDRTEDQLLARLRTQFGRVSNERVVSGPGLTSIYDMLAVLSGRPVAPMDNKALWSAALAGSDPIARLALERFCLSFGSVAGDLALAQGAVALVIAGGLGARLADMLPGSGFAQRFTAKGRLSVLLESMPVKLITHKEPGQFGAAAAFAREHT